MSTSSWLVGSICGFEDQTVEYRVGAGAFTSVPMTFSYTGTYLEHPTAALSMVKALTAALLAAGLTGAYCYVGQDGHVHLEASSSFDLNWTSSGTALRDALGFKTDLSGASSYTATNKSRILWVPRRNESPDDAPLGITGDSIHAATQVVASDGRQVTREFGSPVRRNTYRWEYIDKDQFWTVDEGGGELFAFMADVGIPGAKFYLYRQVDADYSSTSAVTLTGGLGAYEMTGAPRKLPLRRSSGFERTDCKFDFEAKVLKVAEYTS